MADTLDVEGLGREAAQAVVGPGVIDAVLVHPGWTYDNEPTFEFYFRIDPGRTALRPGLVHIRLSQQLQDRLTGAGQDKVAVVHLLDHSDWQIWTDAGSRATH